MAVVGACFSIVVASVTVRAGLLTRMTSQVVPGVRHANYGIEETAVEFTYGRRAAGEIRAAPDGGCLGVRHGGHRCLHLAEGRTARCAARAGRPGHPAHLSSGAPQLPVWHANRPHLVGGRGDVVPAERDHGYRVCGGRRDLV